MLTSGGERLHTAGYSSAGTSPTELWQLLRTLEDERLARTPGAVSTLLATPPVQEPGESHPASFFAVLGVIVLIVLGTLFLYYGVTGLGPGLRAASSAGTVGYFIPQRETTGKGTLWYGEFRLLDGTVLRRDTTINDLSKGSMHTGVPVAARDTGDSDGVFPRDDPRAWHTSADMILAANWFYAAALVVIIRAGIRWRRRDRHDDGGNAIASPLAADHTDLHAPMMPGRCHTAGPGTPNQVICATGQGHK